MRKILQIFNPVIGLSAYIFPFALLLYLVLYLLNTVFPGFVSNIADINLFLIPVFISGVFAVFGKSTYHTEEVIHKKPDKTAYYLICGFSILGFVIVYYKTSDLGQTGLFLSVLSLWFLFIIPFILIIPEPKKIKIHSLLLYLPEFIERNFRIETRIVYTIILITGIVWILSYMYAGKIIIHHLNKILHEQILADVTPVPAVKSTQNIDKESLLEYEAAWNTPVILINSNISEASLSAVTKLLTANKIKINKTISENDSSYTNATILFNPDDSYKAKYLSFLLSAMYSNIKFAPLDEGKSTIEIILGKKQ